MFLNRFEYYQSIFIHLVFGYKIVYILLVLYTNSINKEILLLKFLIDKLLNTKHPFCRCCRCEQSEAI